MKNLLPIFLILTFYNSNGQGKPDKEWNFQPSSINASLLQNNITGIKKDDAGYLWITTQFGIYRNDGQNTKLFSTDSYSPIQSNRFSYILPFQNTLITLEEKNTFVLSNGQIQKKRFPKNIVQITNNGSYYEIKKERINGIPIFNNRLGSSNLLYFKRDTLLFHQAFCFNINQKIKYPKSFFQKFLKSNLFNARNQVFMINQSGIYTLELQNKKIITTPFLILDGPNKYIQHDNQYIWLQQKKQLIKINLFNKKTETVIDLDKFKINEVTSCFEDQYKMYIGTRSQGIFESNIYKGQRVVFKNSTYNENYIYSYAYNEREKYYYSLSNDGLFQFDQSNNIVKNIYPKPLLPYHLQLYKSKLLFVNQLNHVIKFDIANHQTETIYKGNTIRKIDQLNDSIVLIAETNRIIELDLIRKSVNILFSSKKEITTCLKEGNTYWIGLEDGLIYLNIKDYKTTPILTNSYVRTLLRLNKDQLVIGTYGMGAFIYQSNQLIPLKRDPKGISSAVVALSKDTEGNLWVLCNKGTFLWNRQTLSKISNQKFNQYDQFLATNDQIPSEEINGGQIPSTFPKNEIVFPSANGLLISPSNSLIKPTGNPKVLVKAFSLDNDTIPLSNRGVIPAEHNEINFQLDFPFFVSNNNFNVLYKIDGLFQDWRPLPINRNITLNQIGPGDYQLFVKTNFDQKEQQLFDFKVEKFWYTTYSFYLGLGFLLTGVFLFFLKARTRYLRIKQVELEKIIHDNTKQLKEQIKVISQSEKEINKLYKHSNKLYSILMHDLKSPLQFLSSYAVDQFKLTKSEKNTDPDALQTIASTSTDLFKFINEFLYWLQKQNKNQQIQSCKVNLIDTLNEIIRLYEPISSIQNNKILFFPKFNEIFVLTDPDLLKIIFRNLVDNANKFTENGVIKLSCEPDYESKTATIIIQDSGQGLPDYVVELMKQDKASVEYSPSINANHKMGIQITKEFIHHINGQLEVNSNKENGTIFKIHLPLFNNHLTNEKDGIN